MLGAAFSLDGFHIASLCRDKQIRLFNLRTGQKLQEGPSHEGIKAGRIIWLGETDKVVSIGFGRQVIYLACEVND